MENPPQTADSMSIRIENAAELQSKLPWAIAALRTKALSYGDRGILLTRRSPQDFYLQLHSGVPYGFTYEKDEL